MFPIDKAKMPGDGREKNYQSTTWSLNPQAYQNVSNDMVDWAALAQQWIQMKETCPSEDMPAAPPPPPLSGSDFEEQGEAPMEVVEKEEEPVQMVSAVVQGGSQWSPAWNSFRPQTQWRPGWSNWGNPSMVAPPAPSLMRATPGMLPSDFRTPPPIVAQQLITAPTSAWPRARFPAAAILTPTLPEPKVESHVSSAPKSDVNFIQADTTTTIDAAKRKNLPAWIREGLEKMERAKQRQAEKEREEQERRDEIEKRRQVEEAALKELERMKKEEEEEGAKLPVKSKFESDTDSETDGEISDRRRRRSKDSPRSRSPEVKAEVVKKTYEEMMLDVRKNLTEILLEVTNEEIIEIAKETLARAQRKTGPKPILGQSSIVSTSNLPGRLGLAIYGSSDSEGDETEDDEKTQVSGKNEDSDERDSADSDLELQEKIKRQVNAFKKTSRDIEEQLAEEEERDERRRLEREEREKRRKLSSSSHDATQKNNGNVEKNRDGETEQLDRNSTKAGKSSRPKKQSRFSDPKDTVRGTHLTHVSILGAYKSDTLAAGLTKLRHVGEALEAAADRSGGGSSRSGMVTTLASRASGHSKSSRSRRRSDSTSDDDDGVSSTSSNNSNRRRRRRSRSSDRHSRHSHSSHSSRRTRSRSRSREKKSDRRSRY